MSQIYSYRGVKGLKDGGIWKLYYNDWTKLKYKTNTDQYTK